MVSCELAWLGGTVWSPADASFDFVTWCELAWVGSTIWPGFRTHPHHSTNAWLLSVYSLGIGRTGTLITVDVALGLMERDQPVWNICESTRQCSEIRQTPRKYVFDVTSVGQRSSPWTCNSVKIEIKIRPKCKLQFPSVQLMLRQMHLTTVLKISRLSVEFPC